MIRLTLTAKERLELQAISKKNRAEINERVSYVLLSDEGKSVKEIAERVNRHKQTVRKWLKAYRDGGVNALYNKNSPGRPGKKETLGETKRIEPSPPARELPSQDVLYRIVMEDGLIPYQGDPSAILQALHETQKAHGHISQIDLQRISKELSTPYSYTYAIARYDKTVSLRGRGKYVITVCDGTACHLRLSEDIIDELIRYLQVNPGKTPDDRLFTIEQVPCLGACTMAPVISINGTLYGNLTRRKVRKLIDGLRRKEEARHDFKHEVIPVSLETEVPVMKREDVASASTRKTLGNRLVQKGKVLIHQLEHLIVKEKEEK